MRSTLCLRALHCRICGIGMRTYFRAPQGGAMILSCGRMTSLVLLGSLTHAPKECKHQLALLWGTRHLMSPELAGKDLMLILLLLDSQ